MHSLKMLRVLLLFGFAVFSVSANSHFVIVTDLSPANLHALLKNLNISHTSHACLNSSIYYFRSDISRGDLLYWLKHLRKLPGIFSVEYQSAIYVQKKAPEFTKLRAEDRFVELESDDEYALAVKKRSTELRRLLNFNDPNAHELWQFLNDGTAGFSASPGLDINVYPVYAANITGKGVVAIVVDDALDTTHEDLRPNIKMNLTADLLNYTRKDARGTDMQMKKSNDHGTEVAGLIAAVANNSKCAFGVAYNTTLGGVRLLGDKVTDFMVGEALVRFSQEANMYISSWGPSDNGRVMRSPKKYMSFALNRTAHKGNHGRGSVFLFPAGNGGEVDDNCGADGFVNNVHVVSVNAIGENGLAPAYVERCAAISIAVPIGGAPDKVTFRHQISRRHFFVATTDINNGCTKQFVGTSASNPMVGGVIALAMEVNPNLTPRDVAAILSFSGRIPVAAASDFNINGGGMLVSHTYGAGLLNAVRMVNLAKNWNPLGQRLSCLQSHGEMWQTGKSLHQKISKLFKKYTFEKLIFPGKATAFTFTFSQSDCPVEIVELVRVEMHWAHERRGSLDVWLISPSGQVANLLAPRHRDHFSGISHMSWKSLIHTGERCHGNWTVMIMDKQPRGLQHRYFAKKPSGFVRFVSMEMLGTRAVDSAFEKNKEAISKHWLRIQNRTRSINRAVYLRPQTLHKIYDWQRWDALSEDVEP